MSAPQLLIGPLGPFLPDEDTSIVARHGARWLVSERSTRARLRLSDANPSAKVQVWASPESAFAAELGIDVGRAELFSDGLMLAGVAPGEWLALAPGDPAELEATLRKLSSGERVLLADRSSGLALLRLTGLGAAALLGSLSEDLAADGDLTDGTVLTTPIGGVRCTVVRDDLVPEELVDELDVATDLDAPLVESYLLLCDRSLAAPLHALLMAAGEHGAGGDGAGDDGGIAAEGFARYRSYHLDV